MERKSLHQKAMEQKSGMRPDDLIVLGIARRADPSFSCEKERMYGCMLMMSGWVMWMGESKDELRE